jgi:2-keto-myo-inositol isomerase
VKLGFNGACTGPADLRADIDAAAAAGFTHIEVRDAKLEADLATRPIDAVRGEIADRGLSVATLNALERATLPATAASREALLDRQRQLCEWANALDCPAVIAVPSFLDAPQPATEITRRSADMLWALQEIASGYGVATGFEFLGFPSCSVHTLAHATEVVRAVAMPEVRIVIDAFHFYAGASRLQDVAALRADELLIVHLDDAEAGPRETLTDAQRVLPGDGVIPLRPLVDAIRATGYDGVWSIELFRPEYFAWDPAALARASGDRMRALFAPA